MKIINDVACVGIEQKLLNIIIRLGYFKMKIPTLIFIKTKYKYCDKNIPRIFVFRIIKIGFCIKYLR
jgi:hypothetical protein